MLWLSNRREGPALHLAVGGDPGGDQDRPPCRGLEAGEGRDRQAEGDVQYLSRGEAGLGQGKGGGEVGQTQGKKRHVGQQQWGWDTHHPHLCLCRFHLRMVGTVRGAGHGHQPQLSKFLLQDVTPQTHKGYHHQDPHLLGFEVCTDTNSFSTRKCAFFVMLYIELRPISWSCDYYSITDAI